MEQLLVRYLYCSATMGILCLPLLWAVPRLSRWASARSLYAALLVVLVGFVVPLRPTLPIALPVTLTPQTNTALQVSPPILDDAGALVEETISAGPAASMVTVEQFDLSSYILPILTGIWIAGILVVLGFHLVRHARFMRTVNRWREPVRNPQVLAAYAVARESLGVKRSIQLYASPSIASPMLVGFFRHTILVPSLAMKPEEWALILRHELVHFKRGDLFAKALALLATALHWFNPILHAVCRALTLQCEIACDAAVVRGMDMQVRQQYGAAILGVARSRSAYRTALSTTFTGGKDDMKKRIYSLVDLHRKRLGTLLLVCTMALTLVTGAALATSRENAPQTSSTAPVEDRAQSSITAGSRLQDSQTSEAVSGDDSTYFVFGDDSQLPVGAMEGTAAATTSVFQFDSSTGAGEEWEAAWREEKAVMYEEYAPLGLQYDKETDNLSYNGEIVRYFLDVIWSNGEAFDSGNFHGGMRNHVGETGTVDLYTVRGEDGKLTDILPYSQEEFDARTKSWMEQVVATEGAATTSIVQAP